MRASSGQQGRGLKLRYGEHLLQQDGPLRVLWPDQDAQPARRLGVVNRDGVQVNADTDHHLR